MLQQKPEFVPTIPPAVNPNILAPLPQESCTYAPIFDTQPTRLQLDNLAPLRLLPEKLTVKTVLKRALAYTAIFGSIVYAADVAKNMNEEREAVPDISVVLEAGNSENSDHAILVENGFNTTNADYLGTVLGPSLQKIGDGEIWSVQSNNAIANSDAVFEKALELAEQRGIKSISIATYSMGDMRGIETAEKFATESSIPVESIVVISGPSGYDGLREYQQDEMAWAKFLSKAVPGSAYSSYFRYLAELYFYRDSFTRQEDNFVDFIVKNTDRFIGVIDGMKKRFENGDYTRNSYLLRQINAIDTTDIEGLLKRIGESSETTRKPLLIYVGSTAYDNVVDDEFSADEFEGFAENANLDFMRDRVEGVYHSQYYQPEALEAFDSLFEKIAPDAKEIIAQNEAEFNQQVYQAFLLDLLDGDSLDE